MENYTESTTYALGMIQGLRALFQRIATEANDAPQEMRAGMRELHQHFINMANEFPTVSERGHFFIDVNAGEISFHWLQAERDKVVEQFVGENQNVD